MRVQGSGFSWAAGARLPDESEHAKRSSIFVGSFVDGTSCTERLSTKLATRFLRSWLRKSGAYLRIKLDSAENLCGAGGTVPSSFRNRPYVAFWDGRVPHRPLQIESLQQNLT